jgi:RNA polymerase sigma factor (sigma-70 family)
VSTRGADHAIDRDRFEDTYHANSTAILGYLIRRTSNPEDAADLLAEVYLVAWRRIRDVPNGDQARLWLYAVARRVLANERRRAKTRDNLAEQLRTELGQSHLNMPQDDRAKAPDGRALGRLGPSDRELITLTAWEGLTPREIARVIGRPPAVVRVRLHRARRRLNDQLMLIEQHQEPWETQRVVAGWEARRH